MELADLIRVNNLNGCRLCGPRLSLLPQKVALMNHYILFVSDENFMVFYKCLASVRLLDSLIERRYTGSGMTGFTIALYTKNFYVYELTVPNLNDARLLLGSLEALMNVGDVLLHYPFFYTPSFPISKPHRLAAVDDRADLLEALTTNNWRVSLVNKNYEVCPSYPEEVIVPASIPDAVLTESSAFRRSGRFCILVYYHRPRKTALLIAAEPLSSQNLSTGSPGSSLAFSALNAITMATSTIRSTPFLHTSSPSSSVSSSSLSPSSSNLSLSNAGSVVRSRGDEQLLAAVLPDCYRGAILDVRDQVQVKKNPSQGVSESEPNYPQWRRICRPMVPCPGLSKAFRKFIENCLVPSRFTRPSTLPLTTQSSPDTLNALPALGPSIQSAVNPVFDETGTPSRESDSTSTDRFFESQASIIMANSNLHTAAHKRRPVAGWLTIVREALAAAVAGATALDARDAFAQQQFQQAQCIIAQRYKEQQRQRVVDVDFKPLVREEPKLQGSFVLVQSSQGMDRALVVAGLIQVILSPNSRTFLGFQSLIEHTWIRAGHPFGIRCQNSVLSSHATSNESPVFILFLDCVFQIWQQYPTAFEFTDSLLILLAEHAYCSEFGTFLCNSMKEREALQVYEKTVSLWSYLQLPNVRVKYTNPLYSGTHPDHRDNYACWPCLASQAIDVWTEFYQKQQFVDPDVVWEKPRKVARSVIEQFHTQMEYVCHLRSILKQLENEAVSSGLLLQRVPD